MKKIWFAIVLMLLPIFHASSVDKVINSDTNQKLLKETVRLSNDLRISFNVKENSVRPCFNPFPYFHNKFVSWGIYCETSYLLRSSHEKIYFTNFDYYDVGAKADITMNSIYEFDFRKSRLRKIIVADEGKIAFYRLVKFENGKIYYQSLDLDRNFALARSQNINAEMRDSYFAEVYLKLKKESKLKFITLD